MGSNEQHFKAIYHSLISCVVCDHASKRFRPPMIKD